MFDLGFSELLVIAVVALVVLGPQRLPKAARFAGLWVRKARAPWYSVTSEFEREMAAEDLKRSIGDPTRDLRRDAEDIRRELDETSAQVGATLREARADADAADTPKSVKPDEAVPPPDVAADDRPAGDEPSQPSLLPPRRDD